MKLSPLVAKNIIIKLVRIVLVATVPWLVAKGWLNADDAEQLVALLTSILAGAAWSLWTGLRNNERYEVAKDLPAGATDDDVTAAIELRK